MPGKTDTRIIYYEIITINLIKLKTDIDNYIDRIVKCRLFKYFLQSHQD